MRSKSSTIILIDPCTPPRVHQTRSITISLALIVSRCRKRFVVKNDDGVIDTSGCGMNDGFNLMIYDWLVLLTSDGLSILVQLKSLYHPRRFTLLKQFFLVGGWWVVGGGGGWW